MVVLPFSDERTEVWKSKVTCPWRYTLSTVVLGIEPGVHISGSVYVNVCVRAHVCEGVRVCLCVCVSVCITLAMLQL